MDPILYAAVKEGDIKIIEEYKKQLHTQLTPNKNTVLHVAAQFHLSESHIINAIFQEQSSKSVKSMLTWQNSEGETALHIAAKNGGTDIVIQLIRHANDLESQDIENGNAVAMEILRMTNKDGDTALHEAVRYNHADVVVLLVQEDPMFQHPSNNMGETPLYLAGESHYHDIVDSILKTCESPAYDGPKTRTALHAAMVSKCEVCTKKLLEKKPDLAKEPDAFGWTPLHYAALFDFKLGASNLLNTDKSLAHYTADMDDRKTALHVAAAYGSVEVMEEILKHRPDCWEMITSKGQNVLHIAVYYEMDEALDFILSNSWVRNLINQKDAEGNTPLHLYATSKSCEGRGLLRQHTADVNAFNKKDCTPLDVLVESENFTRRELSIKGALKKRGAIPGSRNVIVEENGAYKAQKNRDASEKDLPIDLRKLSETHLIVAALIATVTFAAGFTMPGGYEDNDGPDHGMAILLNKTAFQVFIIADTIAVISSVIAVTLHFKASLYKERRTLLPIYRNALWCIQLSLVAMVIVFITGVCTVLAPSLALAIIVCITGSFAVVGFFDVLGDAFSSFLTPFRRSRFTTEMTDL